MERTLRHDVHDLRRDGLPVARVVLLEVTPILAACAFVALSAVVGASGYSPNDFPLVAKLLFETLMFLWIVVYLNGGAGWRAAGYPRLGWTFAGLRWLLLAFVAWAVFDRLWVLDCLDNCPPRWHQTASVCCV